MTSKFLDQGVFSAIEGSDSKYMLRKQLRFYSYRYDRIFKVPVGFPTNFASIPTVLRGIITRTPRQAEPATLHDWLYNKECPYKNLGRKQCDLVFLDALKANGVGRIKRWLMYQGVRAGGWTGFRK